MEYKLSREWDSRGPSDRCGHGVTGISLGYLSQLRLTYPAFEDKR